MKKSYRFLATTLVASMLMVPAIANAAAEATPAPAPAAPAKEVTVKLDTAGPFAALQVGKQVYVYNESGPLFQTKGKDRIGDLQDVFVLPYGPLQIPFILIHNEKNGYMVFSDLWPEFAKGRENDTVDAYYSGRILPSARSKIVSRTGHHYAEKIGEDIVVYTANDFKDIKKGFHESMRVKGDLRGLILYDCCPYVVVDNGGDELAVYHATEKGPMQAGSIDFQ